MNIIWLFLVVFFSISTTIQAQETDIAILDSLSFTCYDNGDLEQALLYSEQLLEQTIKYGETDSLYAYYGVWKVSLMQEMGAFEEAHSFLLELKAAQETIENNQSYMYADILEIYAGYLAQSGQYSAAEVVWLDALKRKGIARGKYHIDYIYTLVNCIDFYLDYGIYEKAEPLLLNQLELVKATKGKNDLEYAFVVNDLGVLYFSLGNYERATSLFWESKALQEQFPAEETELAAVYNNLGAIYQDQKNYTKAIEFYHKASELYRSWGNDYQYTMLLSSLGNVYKDMGYYEKAEKITKEVIERRASIYGVDHPETALAFINLAAIYIDNQQYALAESLLQKSRQNIGQNFSQYSPGYVSCMAFLSQLYLKTEQYDLALLTTLTSIAANCTNFKEVYPNVILTDPVNQLEVVSDAFIHQLSVDIVSDFIELKPNYLRLMLESLSFLLSNKTIKENIPLYLACSKAAITLNRQLQTSFTGSSSKLPILSYNLDYINCALNGALKLDETGFYKDVFSFAELNKSMLLLNTIQGEHAQSMSNLPDSLIIEEQLLEQEKSYLQKKLLTVASDKERIQLLSEQNELNQQIDIFIKELEKKYPKYHQLKYNVVTTNAGAVQADLDNKTLFLEYLVTDTITYLFALSSTSIELHPIAISKNKLAKEVKAFRRALTDYEYMNEKPNKAYMLYTQKAYWFYQTFLEPALKGTSVDKLIVVADYELGHLPFEAFLTKPSLEQKADYKNLNYLINNYTVSYNYSATLWQENKARVQETSGNGVMLGIVANYDAPIDEDNLLALRSTLDVKIRKALKPLPAAQKEVEALEATFEGTFLKNYNASEANFKAMAGNFDVIHLAMHGLLNRRVPILSALVFSEPLDSLEDNFLQAYEIAQLKLNAGLVVLSACETGYGKFEQGEGVLSLARSFMYAGVPSLVVSLWQVNDGSTAFIMNQFYANLAKGKTKDIALREAKLSYLNNAKGLIAHPAYWSSFIQLGNTDSIYLKQKGTWKNYLYWCCAGMFLVAVFLWSKRREKQLL